MKISKTGRINKIHYYLHGREVNQLTDIFDVFSNLIPLIVLIISYVIWQKSPENMSFMDLIVFNLAFSLICSIRYFNMMRSPLKSPLKDLSNKLEAMQGFIDFKNIMIRSMNIELAYYMIGNILMISIIFMILSFFYIIASLVQRISQYIPKSWNKIDAYLQNKIDETISLMKKVNVKVETKNDIASNILKEIEKNKEDSDGNIKK